MQFSKKNKYILLTLLVILNIIFRIPSIPHEYGVDTFVVHSYANLISSHGFANWIVHPLSIFGMYPFSIPSAVPFMQSGYSQSTGLNMEYTILLTSIIIGLIGMFTSYFMAKEMKDDDLFALLVSYTFSLSPVFLSYTIWTTSTRHLFIALVPLFILGLLRSYKKHQDRLRYILLTIVLFILLGTIHHLVILLAPILIAYSIALIFEPIKIKYYAFNKKINLVSLIVLFIWFSIYMLFIALQVYQLYFYKDFNILWKYQSGFFSSGFDAKSLFINMFVDYGSKIGILSLFGVLGLVILFKKSKRKLYQNFLLMILLIFAPIISMGWYVPLVLLPFFCVLLVYGMLKLINFKIIQKFAVYLILICLLMSTVFSIFMLSHWDILTLPLIQKVKYLQDSTYNLGIYLKEYGGSSFVSNAKEHKISAVSELPVITPPETTYIFDFFNKSDLGINRSSLSLSSLANLDDPQAIYKVNPKIYTDLTKEYNYDVDSDLWKQFNSRYNIKYVVQNNAIFHGRRFASDGLYRSAAMKKPKIYDNSKLGVWYVG